MRFEHDEAIYLGLVKGVDKCILGGMTPGGFGGEFEKILAEMTDRMRKMPHYENLTPLGDSVEIFMVDDIENPDNVYVVFRKCFTVKEDF